MNEPTKYDWFADIKTRLLAYEASPNKAAYNDLTECWFTPADVRFLVSQYVALRAAVLAGHWNEAARLAKEGE
jgi:hypothetical protein